LKRQATTHTEKKHPERTDELERLKAGEWLPQKSLGGMTVIENVCIRQTDTIKKEQQKLL
jgi:hypothetical protein